jgi:hypothetical protein
MNNPRRLHSALAVSQTGGSPALGANGDSTWAPGISARTNVLEYAISAGSYTNNFASTGLTNVLSGGTGAGVITNMLDSGGATNVPARYYRVRVLVP